MCIREIDEINYLGKKIFWVLLLASNEKMLLCILKCYHFKIKFLQELNIWGQEKCVCVPV